MSSTSSSSSSPSASADSVILRFFRGFGRFVATDDASDAATGDESSVRLRLLCGARGTPALDDAADGDGEGGGRGGRFDIEPLTPPGPDTTKARTGVCDEGGNGRTYETACEDGGRVLRITRE